MAYYVVEKMHFYDSDGIDSATELLNLSPIKNYGDALEIIKHDINTHGYTWNPSNHVDPFFFELDKTLPYYAYRVLQISKGNYTYREYNKARETPVQVYDIYQAKHNLVSCGIV